MRTSSRLAAIAIAFASSMAEAQTPPSKIAHLQGEMAGEITAGSVILQSRLTAPKIAADGDVPGEPGVARFEISGTSDFANPIRTPWIEARAENDFIVKARIDGLRPGAPYRYRLVFGPDRRRAEPGPIRSFRTLPGPGADVSTRFVVVTGMNYAKFHNDPEGRGRGIDQGPDKSLGYPALESIAKLEPDFFVGTGDNVYYDVPRSPRAKTEAELRKKWHEQFGQERFIQLFARVPTYWEKDDHDHRFDDCDRAGDKLPSSELGIRIFREQMPVTDPGDSGAVTYRTHRISRLLQIWLLEGRDYRSPNAMADGPDKTLWGKTQRDWLEATLLESDAAFKIVISPTPMIGPDSRSKIDNHVDIGGFRHEGAAFFDWAAAHGFRDKGLYIICGDRHWQYHSIHPTGFEEFSCGALVDANSRLGVAPGDERGTDPEGEIKQPYTSREPSGGFLMVTTEPSTSEIAAMIRFDFLDERGIVLHSVTRQADSAP